MRKRLVAVGVLAAALCAGAGESKGILSSISVEFGGRLKADMSYDDSRTTPGNFAMYVNKEDTPRSRDDDEFNATANESRFWFNLKGPQVGNLWTGGKLEFDFYGAGAAENKAHFMLRRAYIDFGWKEYHLSILAGQHSDVFSPLVPSTLNYSVGWNNGNIGYRRPQLRVTKGFGLDEASLKLEGALTRTIGGEALHGEADRFRDDYGEDSGHPSVQARAGLTFPWVGTSKATVGVSGHWGAEQVEVNGVLPRDDVESYSVNIDVCLPVRLPEVSPLLDFTLSGEWFYGANLDSYLGGIGQGINLTTGRKIRSRGGWGQISYEGFAADGVSLAAGGGCDAPRTGDLNAGARSRNSFVFANVRYNLTKELQVGAEDSWYRTEYHRERSGEANRMQFSVIYTF